MEIQNLSKNFKKKFKTKDLSKRGKCRFDEPKKKKTKCSDINILFIC